jgi:hypothetical protein
MFDFGKRSNTNFFTTSERKTTFAPLPGRAPFPIRLLAKKVSRSNFIFGGGRHWVAANDVVSPQK